MTDDEAEQFLNQLTSAQERTIGPRTKHLPQVGNLGAFQVAQEMKPKEFSELEIQATKKLHHWYCGTCDHTLPIGDHAARAILDPVRPSPRPAHCLRCASPMEIRKNKDEDADRR